jgi:hypothetical protein
LLGVLVVAILMTLHHHFLAQPATKAAYDKIEEKFKEQNAKGVTNGSGKIDAALLTPKDIRDLLGKQPWYVDEHDDYMVECYWWYGLPTRNYVTVKYVGKKGNWRFDTHYLNQKPPGEDPASDVNAAPPVNTPPTKSDDATPAPGRATPMPPGPPGPEKPADKPADEKPADDKPADAKPADEKPAEKPATPEEK